MRISRVFYPHTLQPQQTLCLPENITHYLATVLRVRVGDNIILFNGDHFDYPATIQQITKKALTVFIDDKIKNLTAPHLKIHLGQAICRGEKMDFVVQKSTELGVSTITPLISEFCNVQLKPDKWEKKQQHWQKIANSACEQSGRADQVIVNPPENYADFIRCQFTGEKFILAPKAKTTLLHELTPTQVTVLVGPEGGFSSDEINAAEQNHYKQWRLGPRILRSETAGLAAVSILQNVWGDC